MFQQWFWCNEITPEDYEMGMEYEVEHPGEVGEFHCPTLFPSFIVGVEE